MEDNKLKFKLSSLRYDLSREESVSSDKIFNDSVLGKLVKYRPSSMDELRLIKGLGDRWVNKFGYRILDVINDGNPLPDLELLSPTMVGMHKSRIKGDYYLTFSSLWPFLKTLAQELDDRSYDILNMFADGYSQEDIAQKYDLSPERIRQLVVESIKNSFMTASMQVRTFKEVEAKRDELSLQLNECRLRIQEITTEKIANGEMEEEKKDYVEIKNELLSSLNLSERLANDFLRGDITTISELCRKTEKEFLEIRGVGKKALEEARKILAERGLSFKKEK